MPSSQEFKIDVNIVGVNTATGYEYGLVSLTTGLTIPSSITVTDCATNYKTSVRADLLEFRSPMLGYVKDLSSYRPIFENGT